MGKKSKKRPRKNVENQIEEQLEFSDSVEDKFKLILRVMSWMVGFCFVLIIILPNFDFGLVDVLVKIIFFLGVFNLFLFGMLELFGVSIKRYLSKYIS